MLQLIPLVAAEELVLRVQMVLEELKAGMVEPVWNIRSLLLLVVLLPDGLPVAGVVDHGESEQGQE